MTDEPPSATPLSDRVTGPRRGLGQGVPEAAAHEARLAGAAFAPVKTRRQLRDAIEGGAVAILPLAVVHGALAAGAVFTGRIEGAASHGALLTVALVSYHAIVHGRTIWPSVFVLAWLLVEICLGRWLFGYRFGPSILNIMAVPLAILAVRASWRRRHPGRDQA